MEQPTEKKEWTKPELIVLVRNKPEEAVLGACKNDFGEGPGVVYYLCYTLVSGCGTCDSSAGS
jgi:hypothetical protein